MGLFIEIEGQTYPHPDSINCWCDDVKKWPPVDFPTLYNYFISSKTYNQEEVNNFRSLQAYNYFASGWVDVLSYHKLDEKACFIKGNVMPSQALSEQPRKAWAMLSQDGTKILTAGCSCMAGQGKSCSHVAAILFKVEYAERKGLTGSSCTDDMQIWNQGTKKNVLPAKLKNVVVNRYKHNETSEVPSSESSTSSSRPFKKYRTHTELMDFMSTSPMSRLFSAEGTTFHKMTLVDIQNQEVEGNHSRCVVHGNHELDYFSLPLKLECVPCKEFYEKFVMLSDDKLLTLTSITAMQACEIWSEARWVRITSSGADSVPKRDSTDPGKYLHGKIYNPFQGNSYIEFGKRNESTARSAFQKQYNLAVMLTGFIVSKRDPWIWASPDGLIGDDC